MIRGQETILPPSDPGGVNAGRKGTGREMRTGKTEERATCADCKVNIDRERLFVLDLCPLHAAAGKMLNALKVVVLDPRISGWLEGYDPKALEQAKNAIAAAKGGVA